MMSPLKWDYNTLMYGQFSLATCLSSLLAYSNKSPRLILIQKIVEVCGSTVTISHFGERFRGGQYTLVSFLFAPRCSTCPAIYKSGGTPLCPVVSDPLSGARSIDDGVGSSYLRDGSPSVWSRGRESPGMESGALPPFPAICKNGSTCLVPYGVGATVSYILI